MSFKPQYGFDFFHVSLLGLLKQVSCLGILTASTNGVYMDWAWFAFRNCAARSVCRRECQKIHNRSAAYSFTCIHFFRGFSLFKASLILCGGERGADVDVLGDELNSFRLSF